MQSFILIIKLYPTLVYSLQVYREQRSYNILQLIGTGKRILVRGEGEKEKGMIIEKPLNITIYEIWIYCVTQLVLKKGKNPFF